MDRRLVAASGSAARCEVVRLTLWVVQGGRGGIREERFLARSVIGIGWAEVGDLSSYPNRDALRAAYRGAHPDRPAGHVSTQAAQLWAFGVRMQIGDVVVVPFLRHPEIAIGEITGPYRWVPDGDPDMPHVRVVTWHVTDLPRVAFDRDLRYSFGGSVSVCSVTRNDAERRVRAMIDDL
jgi:restriction system protein